MRNYNFNVTAGGKARWIEWDRIVQLGIKKEVESYLHWLNIYHPEYTAYNISTDTGKDRFKVNFNIGGSTDDSSGKYILYPSRLKYNQYYTVTDSLGYYWTNNSSNESPFVTKDDTNGDITMTEDNWWVSSHLSSSVDYNLATGTLAMHAYDENSYIYTSANNITLDRENENEGLGFKGFNEDIKPTGEDIESSLMNIRSIADQKYYFLVSSDDGQTFTNYFSQIYPTFVNIKIGTTILSKNQPTRITDKTNNTSSFLRFYLADEDLYLPQKDDEGKIVFKLVEKATKEYGANLYLPLYIGNARWSLKNSYSNFSLSIGTWLAYSYNWNQNFTVNPDSININCGQIAWNGEPIISELKIEDDGYEEDFIADVQVKSIQDVVDNKGRWAYNICMNNDKMGLIGNQDILSCKIKIL